MTREDAPLFIMLFVIGDIILCQVDLLGAMAWEPATVSKGRVIYLIAEVLSGSHALKVLVVPDEKSLILYQLHLNKKNRKNLTAHHLMLE